MSNVFPMVFNRANLKQNFRNILVIRPDAVGDFVLMTPMLELLRKHFPQAEITVLARTYAQDLIDRHPFVDHLLIDKIYAGELKGIGNYFHYAQFLRAQKYDLVVHSYTDIRYTFLCFLAGIPARLGDSLKFPANIFLNRRAPLRIRDLTKHTSELNVKLLSPLGIPSDNPPGLTVTLQPEVRDRVNRILRERGITESDAFFAIHLGTGGNNRAWPPQNFREVVFGLTKKYSKKVVLLGGPKEREAEAKVLEGLSGLVVSFVGNTSLSEMAALIDRSIIFICGDTGPIHVGAALQKPIVGIYPSKFQKPARWAPWKTRHIILHDTTTCPIRCIPWECREMYCLDTLTPAKVMSAVETLLKGGGAISPQEIQKERYRNTITTLLVALSENSASQAMQIAQTLRQESFRVGILHSGIPSLVPFAKKEGIPLYTRRGLRDIMQIIMENDISIIHLLPGAPRWRFYLAAHLASARGFVQTPPVVYRDHGSGKRSYDELIQTYRNCFEAAGQLG